MSAPTLTLEEAAAACGVSMSTVRRRREKMLKAGAAFDGRTWSIPVPVFISLGWMDAITPQDQPATTANADLPPHPTTPSHQRRAPAARAGACR